MFVVVAFLVHSLMAHGELALPRPRIEWGVTCILPESLWFRLSLVGNVRLFLKDSQLLLMRLWSLHKPSASCWPSLWCGSCVCGKSFSPPEHTGPERGLVRVVRSGLVAFSAREWCFGACTSMRMRPNCSVQHLGNWRVPPDRSACEGAPSFWLM